MESAGEDEVVIRAQLVQASLVECSVEDEAAGLVDDDEREDSPRS